MATHVCDQDKHPETDGFSPTGRARVLCQVPAASRPGTDTGCGRSKGKYLLLSNADDMSSHITAA